MKLFDQTLNTLERALDVRLERQNVLAANAANVDTPNFKARELDFAREMAARASAHAPPPPPMPEVEGILRAPVPPRLLAEPMRAAPSESAPAGLDGNTVDLDRTMVAMAENALQYGAAARAASKKLLILRYVASDGNA